MEPELLVSADGRRSVGLVAETARLERANPRGREGGRDNISYTAAKFGPRACQQLHLELDPAVLEFVAIGKAS